ncbi:hypothetical protein [Solibacillus sp. CAU 1738]|uniref:hypothetical protein n=1 Tax=Solibacillus sp. CAU 1738 TaxID=3140363 RepID=UPI00326069D0
MKISEVFRNTFIGHLFIFLDINIIGVDILPDALGWFIIGGAFVEAEKVTNPQMAKRLAIMIGVLSLPFTLLSVQQMIQTSIYVELLHTTMLVVSVVFYYFFFSVCLDIAKLYKQESNVRQMKYIFLPMQIINLLSLAILIHLPLVYRVVGVAFTLVGLIVFIMFIVFLWQMKNRTSGPIFDEEI